MSTIVFEFNWFVWETWFSIEMKYVIFFSVFPFLEYIKLCDFFQVQNVKVLRNWSILYFNFCYENEQNTNLGDYPIDTTILLLLYVLCHTSPDLSILGFNKTLSQFTSGLFRSRRSHLVHSLEISVIPIMFIDRQTRYSIVSTTTKADKTRHLELFEVSSPYHNGSAFVLICPFVGFTKHLS